MVECPKCHNQYKDHITYCVFCGLDLVPVTEKSTREPILTTKNEAEQDFFAQSPVKANNRDLPNILRPRMSPLSAIFAVLGICSLLGGFAYAIHLWPEKFRLVYGFIPSSVCFPSIASFLLGIIACCMCLAMAQIISSLKNLEYIIFQIANKD
jgi:hypothetical protein